MKPLFIEAFDLNDAWYKCLREVIVHGYEYIITKGSYEGQKRKEFDYVTIRVTNPGNKPLIPIIPDGLGIPAPSSEEYVERYVAYLMTSEKKPGEAYTYGERLVDAKVRLNITTAAGRRVVDELPFATDQIQRIIEMYKEKGEGTNHAILQVAMPSDIELDDPPCLRHIDTRIRYGKLHFFPYFRSWDLWAGFPSNLAAIQILKEQMAAQIGIDDGEIIASSKGLHLYDYAWPFAETRTYQNSNKKD